MRAYSIPEVAEIAGLSRQSVHDHVVKGHIPCMKLSARTWRIPGAWVEQLTKGEVSLVPDTSIHTTVQATHSLTEPDIKKQPTRGKAVPK